MPHEPNRRPDILFFFSDQHHGLYSGYAGHPIVQTPNLDRIAANGTAFDTAYTACPLCVPARSAMLSGQLASRTGIFGNQQSLHTDQATFLHAIGAEGYETVLCGRMHFKGPDQRHGFSKRLCGDITALHSGGIAAGEFFGASFGMRGCADLAGGGNSPTLEYDRTVVRAVLDYLAQDHERPQCIVVGTYGPHFPYIAPPDLFEQYLSEADVPVSWDPEAHDPNPLVDAKRQRIRRKPVTREESPVTEDVLRACRAAYFGLITEQDRHVGAVRDAWQEYLERRSRPGFFVYSSDHGDTCGEHGIFGKQTFYEGSVRIPLLFEGAGVAGGQRVGTPASILDIGPTLCEAAGAAPPPSQDGISLLDRVRNPGNAPAPDRAVVSEWTQRFQDDIVTGRMVRRGPWKLIHFEHADMPDQLFHLEDDPDEMANRVETESDVRRSLLAELLEDWQPADIVASAREEAKHQAVLRGFKTHHPPPEPETDRWPVPEATVRPPDILV